jgi:pimeloyl-ACP methyl ester carboxylesterase
MAFADAGDTRIHYQVTGPKAGEPVVLIMGLGWDMSGWDALLPRLHDYRVVRLDNRGAGRSGAPDTPYSIPLMARDTLSVMDAAGVDTAHVYGASLGSMVAQEIALSHASRVRSLILGCPSPGVISVPGAPGIIRLLMTRERYTPEEMFRKAAPYLFHRALAESPELIADAMRRRLAVPINEVGYRRQLQATVRWSSLSRLPRLRVPTLVLHGDHDRLIPDINGRIIARLIRGATFHSIKDAGHVYSVDAPDEVARVVLAFIDRHRIDTATLRPSA